MLSANNGLNSNVAVLFGIAVFLMGKHLFFSPKSIELYGDRMIIHSRISKRLDAELMFGHIISILLLQAKTESMKFYVIKNGRLRSRYWNLALHENDLEVFRRLLGNKKIPVRSKEN